MIVYRLWTSDPSEGHCYEWFASNEHAEARLKKFVEAGGSTIAAQVVKVTLPDTKMGMIQWLNSNFTRDNG